MRASTATKKGLRPLAEIVGTATHAQSPRWFTAAPVGAMRKLPDKIDWRLNQVDLFEINEAFAVVPMVAMRELDLPHDKVNVHGGACARGHPIGASGARIIVSLLAAMERQKVDRRMAAVCIGGGEATAMAIERMQ
jgi:acetyl-CoA C-acetyltransferase